jgi:hypothetical protein
MRPKTIPLLPALALAACGWTTQLLAQTAPRVFPPRVSEQDTIWIASVPSGLKVYFSPDIGPVGDAEKDAKNGIPIVESHPAIDQRHLRGVTPLVLHKVTPGKYLLAVAPVLLLDKNYEKGEIDDLLPAKVFVSFQPLGGPKSLENGIKGAAVYSVIKKAGASEKVLVLALPPDATLETLESNYPPETSYSLDDTLVSKKLLEAMVPEADVPRVVGLLRRGGKVILYRGALRWAIVLSPEGTPTIITQVRAPNP